MVVVCRASCFWRRPSSTTLPCSTSVGPRPVAHAVLHLSDTRMPDLSWNSNGSLVEAYEGGLQCSNRSLAHGMSLVSPQSLGKRCASTSRSASSSSGIYRFATTVSACRFLRCLAYRPRQDVSRRRRSAVRRAEAEQTPVLSAPEGDSLGATLAPRPHLHCARRQPHASSARLQEHLATVGSDGEISAQDPDNRGALCGYMSATPAMRVRIDCTDPFFCSDAAQHLQ